MEEQSMWMQWEQVSQETNEGKEVGMPNNNNNLNNMRPKVPINHHRRSPPKQIKRVGGILTPQITMQWESVNRSRETMLRFNLGGPTKQV